MLCAIHFGAGGRGRTGTILLSLDFESSTSANSITPANEVGLVYRKVLKKSIPLIEKINNNLCMVKIRIVDKKTERL